MQITTVKCDACGATKQASNHWFMAIELDSAGGIGGFAIRPLEPERRHLYKIDLCSEQCAARAMSKAIGKQREVVKS